MDILSKLLFALSMATTPPSSTHVPDYQIIGTTPHFTVEIDLNSLVVEPKIGGWQIKSTIKRVMLNVVEVEGKNKKGSYYIEATTTRCAQDTLTIDSSTLFTEEGEVLAARTDPTEFTNPKTPGYFITDYIDIMCNTAKNMKLPMLT